MSMSVFSKGLTLRRHPRALLRRKLERWGIGTAGDLRRNGRDKGQVRASGIVTHRQQPSTASSVIFAPLEDETGAIKTIVWPSVAEMQRPRCAPWLDAAERAGHVAVGERCAVPGGAEVGQPQPPPWTRARRES